MFIDLDPAFPMRFRWLRRTSSSLAEAWSGCRSRASWGTAIAARASRSSTRNRASRRTPVAATAACSTRGSITRPTRW